MLEHGPGRTRWDGLMLEEMRESSGITRQHKRTCFCNCTSSCLSYSVGFAVAGRLGDLTYSKSQGAFVAGVPLSMHTHLRLWMA